MLLTHSDFEKLLETREPTAEELTAINAYCPMGADPWEASELLRFPMMASNNLIHGSLMAWDETALTTMVASYPGCPLMIDHEWDRCEKTFGMVYDALLYSLPRVSEEGMRKLLSKSPNPSEDRAIIERDGYHQVLVFAFVEQSHPGASDVLYGRRANVSIGANFYGKSYCPICNTPYEDKHCEHYPPYMAGWVEEELLTPYYRRTGKIDSLECSFVFAGNCRQARILDKNLNAFVMA
jgi:hypothetical protein